MTAPAQLLEEAGGTLTRAQALLERAAVELGPPFDEALRLSASDIERIRRRVRNQTATCTAGGGA